MNLFRIAIVLALSLTSQLLAAQPSAAQQRAPAPAPEARSTPLPPLSETLTGAAKAEYDAARILFGDGDFAGALVKFERALEHSSDLRLLWNMAVCEKSLRHYVRMLRLLDRYRNEGGARLTGAQRAEVAQVVQTVQTLISELQLNVTPDGAEVFIDEVSQGVTPLREPLLVDLGTRKIRIAKADYDDWQVTRDFAGHSSVVMTVTLSPAPKDGRLTIFAEPGSSIFIDDQQVGDSGHFQGAVLAGEHHVQVTAPGKVGFSRDLVLKVNESRTLHVSLPGEPSNISPWLWVGAGVLVAGGAATGIYFLTRSPSEPKPVSGTLPPFVITLGNN